MDRLRASPATRLQLRRKHVPGLHVGPGRLLEELLVLDDLVGVFEPVRHAGAFVRERDRLLELLRILYLL